MTADGFDSEGCYFDRRSEYVIPEPDLFHGDPYASETAFLEAARAAKPWLYRFLERIGRI